MLVARVQRQGSGKPTKTGSTPAVVPGAAPACMPHAHILLRRDSFTRKHFHAEALWHIVAGAFTCKYCYTAVFILRAFSLHTRMLCHRDAFDHACFNAEIFLHGDTFAQRECLLTHTHTNTVTERLGEMIVHWAILRTEAKTNRGAFYKGMYVHEGFLVVGIFTQTYYWMISCFGHAYGPKSAANICKITVSPQLLVETHFVGNGWPSTNPHCNLTSMFDDWHFVRQGCVSWTLIHAAFPLEEKS